MKPLQKGKERRVHLNWQVLCSPLTQHYFDGHLICIITLCNSLATCSKAFWTSSVNSVIEMGPPLWGKPRGQKCAYSPDQGRGLVWRLQVKGCYQKMSCIFIHKAQISPGLSSSSRMHSEQRRYLGHTPLPLVRSLWGKIHYSNQAPVLTKTGVHVSLWF